MDCKKRKILTDFYAHPQMKDGRLNRCKKCHVADGTARKKANPEKTRAYGKAYQAAQRKKHPGRARAAIKAWQEKNRARHLETRRRSYRRKRYGMEYETYLLMVKKQRGLCGICRKKPSGTTERTKKLHVDHCHKTGKVRGLLCSWCNVALGYFRDDPKILADAGRYLSTSSHRA